MTRLREGCFSARDPLCLHSPVWLPTCYVSAGVTWLQNPKYHCSQAMLHPSLRTDLCRRVYQTFHIQGGSKALLTPLCSDVTHRHLLREFT